MSREAVKVVVRGRPMDAKETAQGCESIVHIDCTMGLVALHNPRAPDSEPKSFTFDNVYDHNSTQRGLYDETAYPLVESVMEGYNGTMFAYGQTGCGKTFTMQGKESPPELRGVIPNSFDHIFENIKIATKKEFLVRVAYLEIYNEEIRDLLGADPHKKCDLKEDPERGVFVKGLTDVVVDSVSAIDSVMNAGNKNRTVGATLMNAESSRSHSIFTVIIEMSETAEERELFRKGKLNLVDLAGSERPSKTGATGARMKEGIKINMSLTALGNVISTLVEGKAKHIPYRDSKLTRLLQDSLGGNTKTVMMAAISPADYNYDETLGTLRYANRAKNIKNKPIVNEDPKDALLRQYKDEIERLRQMLEAQMVGGAGGNSATALIEAMSERLDHEKEQAAEARAKASQAAPSPAGATGGAGAAHPASGGAGGAERAPPIVATPATESAAPTVPQPAVTTEPVASATPAEPRVEKEIVRDVVKVEVVPKQVLATQNALKSYNQAVIAQRNRLGEELEKKAEEAEKERAEREALAAKLLQLTSKVMKSTAIRKDGSDDPEVILARQQHDYRKAQLRLKQQKKREAKVRAEREQALEEKKELEEDLKSKTEEAETKIKAMKRVKAKYQKKLEELKSEMADQQEEWQRQREMLMNTVREQNKETKLLEQLVAVFLPPKQMGKVWERAVWNEETEEWQLPRIKPRPGFAMLKLPTLGGGSSPAPPDAEQLAGSGAGGGYVSTSDSGGDVKPSKERKRKKRSRSAARRKDGRSRERQTPSGTPDASAIKRPPLYPGTGSEGDGNDTHSRAGTPAESDAAAAEQSKRDKKKERKRKERKREKSGKERRADGGDVASDGGGPAGRQSSRRKQRDRHRHHEAAEGVERDADGWPVFGSRAAGEPDSSGSRSQHEEPRSSRRERRRSGAGSAKDPSSAAEATDDGVASSPYVAMLERVWSPDDERPSSRGARGGQRRGRSSFSTPASTSYASASTAPLAHGRDDGYQDDAGVSVSGGYGGTTLPGSRPRSGGRMLGGV